MNITQKIYIMISFRIYQIDLGIKYVRKEYEYCRLTPYFFFRLLDVAHGQRLEREMSLYLIFEHLYCDLSEYLADRPILGDGTIKVILHKSFNFCHLSFLRIKLII